MSLLMFLSLGWTSESFADTEKFFCVPVGTMFVGDFKPFASVQSREVTEVVTRGSGDGDGFILTLDTIVNVAEMRVKRTLNGVEKETVSSGPITLANSNTVNVTLDDAVAKNYGYDGNGNSRLVSLVLMRESGEYLMSALMISGDAKSSFVAGGRCNKL